MTADENATGTSEASVGAWLRSAREAAGLSEDAVAQQLKLAPRQVRAIEEDDYARLPGRTFVRGFVRNYARLLKLDVDAVLEALPGEFGSAPERPPLAATSRVIGEMPRERAARPNVARWVIPLVLIAIVAVAAFYEFARPPASRTAPPPASPASPAPAPSSVPLANPVRPNTSAVTIEPEKAAASSSPTTETTIAAPASAASAPTTGAPAAAPATTESTMPSPVATPATLTTGPAPSATVAAPAGARNLLTLRFRGASWIEVRDRSGSVVLSMTGSEGVTRDIAVATPAEVTVGNVAAVDAAWRGRALDLSSQAKQNVARIKLD